MEITDPTQLDGLMNSLHDRPYDLESLSFDPKRGSLTLATSVVADQPENGRYKVLKARLHILDCSSYELRDEARVGEGHFNRIEFDDGALVIAGSLPVTLTAQVRRLHLKLEVTDEVIRTVSSFRRSYLKS